MKHFLRNLALVALMCVPWVTQGQQNLPYTMDFEDATEFGNWTAQSMSGLSGNESEMGRLAVAKHNGDYGFRFSSYNDQGTEAQYLISPELNAPSGGVVTFGYAASSSSGTEKFKVGYSTTNNSIESFFWSNEYSTSSKSWQSGEETFPPNTKYIAFYYYSNYQYRLFIDDISLSAPPSCAKVTGVTVSNITSSTATVSWTDASNSGASYMVYTTNNTPLETTPITTTSYTITDCLPNTTYSNFSVRAICGDNDESDAVAVPTFKTLCEGVESYSTNFDDMSTGYAPSCWTALAGSCDVYGYSSPKSGSNHLRLCSATNIVVLPAPLSVETNTMQLEFYAKMIYTSYSSSYYYNGDLQVGYLTNPSDASSFVAVRTLAYGSDYTSYPATAIKVPMTSAPAGAVIAFRCQPYYASTSYGWYIDDVTIGEAPNCVAVTVNPTTNITATSARINWTSTNAATTTYTISDGNEINITTNPGVSYYDLTELTANTDYGPFTITANCGGEEHSDPVNIPGFRTACNAFAAGTTWNFEGMTTNGIPECWYRPSGVSGTAVVKSSTSYSHGGSLYLDFRGSTSNLIVLPLTEAEINTLQMKIWMRPENAGSSSCGTFSVGYVTDVTDPTTFIAVETYSYNDFEGTNGSNTQYAQKTVYLNAAPNGARMAMRHNSGSTSYYWYVDDVTIEEMSSCMPVANLTAPEANITPNSVALTWTDNNSGNASYVITDGQDNVIPAAQISNLTATGVTITGLTPNTAYTFKVKADCGNNEYSDAVSVNVRTACGQEAIPFTEDFETGASSVYVLDCWKAVPNPTGSSSEAFGRYNSSSSAHGGSYSLRSYSGYYSTINSKVILPELDAATNTLQVRFWQKPSSTSAGSLQVGYVTDVNDTSTFVTVQSFSASTVGTSYLESEVSFENAPAGARIAFRHLLDDSYYYYWYIDDITVEPIPACKKVTAVTAATNVTSSGATLSWTDTRNEGAVYKVYNKVTDPATLLGTTEAGVKTINLTGLTASTTYNQLVIVASCSENEQSGEVSVPSFTTQSNACAITTFNIAAAAGIQRGDAVIDGDLHTVTVPVYYCTTEELAAASGSFVLSTPSARAYVYNAQTEAWDINVTSWNDLRSHLAMGNTTVRVFAQDVAVYQDWTITLQGEACSTPRSMAFEAERTRFTANWACADPAAENFQVICSATRLTTDEARAAFNGILSVEGQKTHTFTGLLRETKYYVYVRTACGNESYSTWLEDSVTTKGLTFCEDIVVADGGTSLAGNSSNRTVPLWGYNTDDAQHSQMIYPASMLTELQGKTITGIKYYVSSGNITSWNGSTYPLSATFSLAITTNDNLSSGWDETTGTAVFTGAFESDGSITFTTPFTYTGGNLLVDIDMPTRATYSNVGFYGQTVANASRNAYGTELSGSGTIVGFLPKISFHYCESNEACPTVTEVVASEITETSATITWDASAGDYVSGYQVIQSETELDAAALDAYNGDYAYEGTALTCNLTSLSAYTTYYVYVRANCGAPDNTNSTWQSTSFRTLSACGVVSDLAVEITGKHTATATWTKTKPAQANNFNYILMTEEEMEGYPEGITDEELNAMVPTVSGIETLTANLESLESGTRYYLYVQNSCGNDGLSPWVYTVFVMPVAMPAVTNLTVTDITHSAVAVTWEKNVAQYADETAWQVAYTDATRTFDQLEDGDWTTVSAMRHTFLGLTPETDYLLYVRPYDAESGDYGDTAQLAVTTAAIPSPCVTVADGDKTTTYVPVYGNWYDNPQRTQSIYPASMLTEITGKTITGMKYYVSSTSSNQPSQWFSGDYTNVEFNVTLAITEQSSFSTAAWDMTTATTVYTGQMGNDGVITFDAPFVYNGGNLLVTFNMPVRAAYKDVKFDAIEATNGSVYKYNTWSTIDNATPNLDNHLPKVQFCYEQDANACLNVTNVSITGVTAHEANISWMPGNQETAWNYVLRYIGADPDATTIGQYTETPYLHMDAMEADMDYNIWIRPICGQENGNWTAHPFTTVATCGLPTVLAATDVTATTATLHALAHPTIGTAQNYGFRYWKAGDEAHKYLATTTTENSTTLYNLIPNTTYYYDVMVECDGDQGGSRWSAPLSFTTKCAAVAEFPWTEDFEGYAAGNFVDNCWVNEHISGSGTNIFKVYTSNNGGNTTHQLQLPDQDNGTLTKLVLPVMTLPGNDYVFALDVFRSSSYSNKTAEGIRVYASANGEIEGATELAFIPRYYSTSNNVIPAESTQGWYTYKLPLDMMGTCYIIIRGENQYGTSTYMDNFVVRQKEKYSVATSVTMTAEATPAPMGSISNTPETITNIYEDTPVSLTATPNYGYQFVNWTEGENIVSTSATYNFTLEANRNLVANFDSLEFTITPAMVAQQQTEEWGAVSDPATVKFNLPVTIMAEASEGYRFVNWTNSHDEVAGTEPSLTVNAYRDSTFTAHFDTIVYNVTVNVTNDVTNDRGAMGTVSGPATIKHFLNADYVANEDKFGYHFVNWTNENGDVLGTESTLNIAAVSDTVVNANYTYNQYTVTAVSNDEAMGTVSGTATVNYLTNVPLTATPNTGYHFENWTEGGIMMSPLTSIEVSAFQDRTYTANFAINSYDVTATAAPTAGGTVTGAGTYDHFSTATLVATPATGYHFVNWTEGNEEVSTDASYSYTVTGARDLVAHFAINNYTIAATAEHGTVTGAGDYDHFATATLTAAPAEGYHFVNWTEDNEEVATTATYSFEVSGARTLVAHFAINNYAIGTAAEHGTVTGAGNYDHFSTVTLTATEAEGYHFVNWTNNLNNEVSTTNPLSFTATQAITYTAHFAINNYTIAATTEHGTVTGAGNYDHFATATLEATPATGYHFVNWTEGGEEVSSNATYAFEVSGARTLVANFDTNVYQLTVNVAVVSEGRGTVSGSNPAAKHFLNYTISATPANGYHFVRWSDGSTQSTRTVTLTGDSTFTAEFDTTKAELAWSADAFTGYTYIDFNAYKPTLTNPNGVSVRYGTTSTIIKVDPETGAITNGFNVPRIIDAGTYTIYAVHNLTPDYFYDSVAYTLTVAPSAIIPILQNNEHGGSWAYDNAEDDLTHAYSSIIAYLAPGASFSTTATANEGYHFTAWQTGNNVDGYTDFSTENTITYTAPTTISGMYTDGLKVVFDTNEYQLNANVAEACTGMGTVTGSTTAKHFLSYEISATANEGYHFVRWTDGSTQSTRTVSLTSDSTFTAEFAINLYNLTLAYDATRGTVTNSANATVPNGYVFENVEHGTVLNLTAEVNEGSRFTGWNDGTATVTTASITYTVTAPATLTANFIDAGNFQVTLNYNNVMGTVTGAGEHHADNPVAIAATANYGYHFVAWVDENGDSIFTPEHSFTMPQSEVEFTAVFDYNQYTVTAQSANTTMGTVIGTNTVNYLTPVALTATDNYGYHFVNWTEADTVLSTDRTVYVPALSNRTITAVFGYNQYTVTGVSANETMGSVEGTSTVDYLSNVTLTAVANTCYHFTGWSNGETTESIVVQANESKNLTAYFAVNIYEGSESVTTCDSYVWNGRTYTVGDIYTIDTFTVNGCDSTATLELTLNYSTTGIDEQTECDEYMWMDGITYTESTNEPTYTIANVAGCDSVITLHLTINNSNTGVDVQTACDSYEWIDGETYTESTNEPTFTLTNENGCDSVVTLNLTVNYSTEGDTTAVACDSFTWYGVEYTETPLVDPTHVFTNAAGCDSIVTIYLTVNYSTTGIDEQTECDEYMWMDGITYTESTNEPTYTIANVAGCDSVITLHLTINNSNTGVDAHTACDSYEWIDGETYTESTNEPTFTLTNENGCDSVVTLNLTINYSSTGDTTAVACDNFTWYGVEYTETPLVAPTHVFTNAAGCDSIVTLNLTVNYSNTGVDEQTACDSYEWHGQTYTASNNTATFTETNAAGCDSVVTLNLTINYSNTGIDEQTACDSYVWHGTTYNESNSTATFTETNVAGCDSVVTLNLTVNYSNTGDTAAVACDSFEWYGTTYNQSATPTHTFTNEAGCDSVVTLNLTINYSNTGIDEQTVCDSYIWHGTTYNESNSTATFTETNVAGCDSVVTLNLTVNYSNTGDTAAVACDGFEWYGTTYSQSATPTHTFTNAAGCDSVVTLNLTVNYSNTGIDEQTACDSYVWHGTTYNESNSTATFTETNLAGCDSVVTLNLTVNYSNTGIDEQTACDSYVWHGTTYNESNSTATFTETNVAGCDSVVTLNLTVNYSNTGIDEQTACDSYQWHGTTYTESNSTATYTETNIAGCDSVVTLNLTINYSNTGVETITACNSYVWHGIEYTASTNEPTFTETNAAGCDSTVTLNLTINQCSVTTLTVCDSYTWNKNNVTYTQSGEYYSGNDTLVLTVNYSQTVTQPAETVCDSYEWNGQTYTQSANLSHTTLGVNGCDSTTTLVLTINYSSASTETVTACNSYVWHGTEYTASTNEATYITTNAAGCDSTVTLNLTINQCSVTTLTVCDSYTWNKNNMTYTQSGEYYSGNDTLVLTVNYSNTGVETATACDSYQWHGITYTASNSTATFTETNAAGCDRVVTLNLTINYSTSAIDEVTATDSYTWIDGVTYTESTNEPTYTTTNAAGCDSVVTLHLTLNHTTYYTVTLATADATMGSVSPAGATQVAAGTSFTATATALTGRHFVAWTSNGAQVSTEASYTFNVTEDVELTATFDYDDVTVEVSVNDVTMGTTNPAPGTYTFHVGDEATVTVVANEGYHFTGWVVNGTAVETTDEVFTIEVIPGFAGMTFTVQAVFAPNTGIDDIENTVSITTVGNKIVVSGANDNDVYVYDVNGRVLNKESKAGETVEFTMNSTGVYLVKVGSAPAKRVVLVR